MFYSVGFYVAYRYNIKAVKREMRSAIASRQYQPDELFIIEIPLENNVPTAPYFEKVDKHEFRYHGHMYDIVKTQLDKDKVTYTCISDKEETHLIAVFADEVMRQNDHPLAGKKAVTLIKFSSAYYTFSENTFTPVMQDATIHVNTRIVADKLTIAYLNIPSPPPWLS